MASIPYSILFNQNENILPVSIIQDHQKFCRQFMKAHQTFEKYNKTKSKLAFINDNVFLFCKKKTKSRRYIKLVEFIINRGKKINFVHKEQMACKYFFSVVLYLL